MRLREREELVGQCQQLVGGESGLSDYLLSRTMAYNMSDVSCFQRVAVNLTTLLLSSQYAPEIGNPGTSFISVGRKAAA